MTMEPILLYVIKNQIIFYPIMQVCLVNQYFFRYSVFSMILYLLYPTQLRDVIKTYFGIQTKNAARSSTIKVSVTFISAYCKYTVYNYTNAYSGTSIIRTIWGERVFI